MAIHSIFSPDLIMDLGMLLTVQLAYGSFRPVRLLAAEGMMAACTLLVRVLNIPAAAAIPMHLPVFFFSAMVATGEHRFGRILEAAACMFCAGAAAAGFVSIGGGIAIPAAIPCIPLLLFLFRRRRHENYRWNIEVYLEKDGLGASLPALVDTGNRLRERESGLPVFIAEAGALPQIAEYTRRLPPEQVRILPFGVLGSTGEISCFRPDKLEIILPGKGRLPAPPCWVAVFPGRIPGSTRALAPPTFTKALETKRSIFKRNSIE